MDEQVDLKKSRSLYASQCESLQGRTRISDRTVSGLFSEPSLTHTVSPNETISQSPSPFQLPPKQTTGRPKQSPPRQSYTALKRNTNQTHNNKQNNSCLLSSPVTSHSAGSGSKSIRPVFTPTYRDIIAKRPELPRAKTNPLTTSNKDDDGFQLVHRKKRPKRNNNMCGTSQTSKLQVAELSSAVYVSRLNKTASVELVKEHIRDMGEECISVEKLSQWRDTDFLSFKVTVIRSKLGRFLEKDFWPEGIKYRPFRYPVAKNDSKRIGTQQN